MSANNTSASAKSEYFNLTIKGIGYLSNIRQVNHQNGSFLSCVINALSGPTDNPAYVRFDISVAGKEATSLIARCQKAVDEDKKVLLGFNRKRAARTVLTGMCYSVGSATRQGSSSLTRFIGQSAMTLRT